MHTVATALAANQPWDALAGESVGASGFWKDETNLLDNPHVEKPYLSLPAHLALRSWWRSREESVR